MAKLTLATPTNTDLSPAIEDSKIVVPEVQEGLAIKKEKEFGAFLAWLSLPVTLRYPPKVKGMEQQTPREYALSMGIDDEEVLGLIELKTAKEFGERFEVDPNTLTDWKKLIYERDMLGDLTQWAKPLSRNVMMSLYNKTMRGGLPEHYALWFKLNHQWSDKINIDIRKRVIKTITVKVVHPKDYGITSSKE